MVKTCYWETLTSSYRVLTVGVTSSVDIFIVLPKTTLCAKAVRFWKFLSLLRDKRAWVEAAGSLKTH